jgi:hypothetical protein
MPDPEIHFEDGCWHWFQRGRSNEALTTMGFRLSGGGVHQSKTMMLREVERLLDAQAATGDDPEALVLGANVLGKPTVSARRLALERLRGLYGIGSTFAITRVLSALWRLDPVGRPSLALLCALARDPLLRVSAEAVTPSRTGVPIRWPQIADRFTAAYPDRFSPKMLKSLSQNCASTWTQSGHLRGKVRKIRAHPMASPGSAAFAAWLATLAGFGGPALLDSPWLDVLDRSHGERLGLLRQAEAVGLTRVRVAGEMVEIAVKQPLAQTLGMPDLGDV